MKRVLSLTLMMNCFMVCEAQTVENPVFDRTDIPEFRVEKIEINQDTTYVHCTYMAEEGSWANISSETYIEDTKYGAKYPILKVEGIPFGPDKRYFDNSAQIDITLFFPSFSAKKINIIEDAKSNAFNIYGINLYSSYEFKYTDFDIDEYHKLATEKEEKNEWHSAINYTLKQLEASKYVYGELSIPSAWAMFNLTMEYPFTKEYEKTVEWGNLAIDILTRLAKDTLNLDILARTYGNVSTAYFKMGENTIAIQYMEKSLNIRKQVGKMSTIDYDDYLRYLAQYYYYEENYPKALLYAREWADLSEKKYNENNYYYVCYYINSLCYLSTFLTAMGMYEESINVGNKAIKLFEENKCEDVEAKRGLRQSAYTSLARNYAYTGKKDIAIEILERYFKTEDKERINDLRNQNAKMLLAEIKLDYQKDTLSVIKEYEKILKTFEDSIAGGRNDLPAYSEILHKLFSINIKRNPDLSKYYFKRNLEQIKNRFSDKSIAYGNLLLEYIFAFFAEAIFSEKGKDIILNYLRQSTEIIKRHINNSTYNMSKAERNEYWRKYETVFTWLIPSIIGVLENNEGTDIAYDVALFYKGMLLSSELEINNVISTGNDKELKHIFSSYKQNLMLLEDYYSSKNTNINRDSLNKEIKEQELELARKITHFNKQYKGTIFSWKEVQNRLHDDDVSIEIVSYRGLGKENAIYQGYVIDKFTPVPQLVFLFTDDELKECIHEDSIDYNALGQLIWEREKMKNAIKKAKNIYFSTSGLLNRIGIEYLPISDGQYIFDKYNLFRLSSTRELCVDNKTPIVKNAWLYGGLDYNNVNEHENENNQMNKPSKVSRSFRESLLERGGFEPLIGSKEEVYEINEELKRKKIVSIIYSESEGTEESIKKTRGDDVNIIHLSTHGMFLSVNDNDKIFNFVIEDNALSNEEQALSRSFLVMSGGNMLITKDSIPNTQDDGILTALEISHLDFRNLDLVTLSACQTALGDITSEGVYGLQRGFKKAGANTILMSLDKVDDEATKILMVEFYKNLMNGKTKHQSLIDAQKYLRQVDNGKYDKPEYWASFIMLDGLN